MLEGFTEISLVSKYLFRSSKGVYVLKKNDVDMSFSIGFR